MAQPFTSLTKRRIHNVLLRIKLLLWRTIPLQSYRGAKGEPGDAGYNGGAGAKGENGDSSVGAEGELKNAPLALVDCGWL